MKNITLGLIGFGTIGTGVVRLLNDNAEIIKQRSGFELTLKKIADIDINTDRGVSLDGIEQTTQVADVLNDPDIDVVIELIGGINPAKEFVLEALKKGKHVVTANKALLAECGAELFAAANEAGKSILFEASVCGGIPVIKSIREGLVGNQLNSLYGIVNGTSNYILSRMSQENITFSEALKEAQEKGYAEADPTLDISGADSAHKLLIIASLAYGSWLQSDAVFVEGIENITALDIDYSRQLGYAVKLLAIAKKKEDGLELRVHPTLVPENVPLASVCDTYNALFYEGDFVEKGLLFGRGAGEKPTASAVVSDLVDSGWIINGGAMIPLPDVSEKNTVCLLPLEKVSCKNYIRVTALDKPGVLSQVGGILAKYGISISSVIQTERHHSEGVPVIMMTHTAFESDFQRALEEIDELDDIKDSTVRIRVEDEL